MRFHWPIRRLVLVVGAVVAMVALVSYLWANGQTDSGLYCTSAYPETNGDAACGVCGTAAIVFLVALVVCALAGVAELIARVRAALG